MYDKLNITENHLQALALFTNGFDREYYIREVEKLLKISPRTSQLMLDDLENKGLLESKTRGKIRLYKLRNSELCRRYLSLVEKYKAISFLEKKAIIREVIEKASPFIEGIGMIFGSYAKGGENKDSDLDIFIAGSCNAKELKKISSLYGIEISVKCYPIENFENGMATDILIKEVLNNHIVFLNSEQFVKLAMKWIK